MRYSGSKRRFMKELTPILMEHVSENTLFVDAMMGGANVLSEIPHDNKIGVEINRYVFSLWRHLQTHGMEGIPEFVDEQTYNDVKNDYLNQTNKYPDYLIGYVGNCCSYGGAWFNGYARYNPKKHEDHIREAYNGLKKQVENFKHFGITRFLNHSYEDIQFMFDTIEPHGDAVIYCDPPYADTKKYESDFDHVKFWDWVRMMSKRKGVYVYVSEYEAPDDFECVWEKKKKDGMGTTKSGRKQNIKTEKLFVYRGK